MDDENIKVAEGASTKTNDDTQKKSSKLKFWKKTSTKKSVPSDAVSLGCGGLFRRRKKQIDADDNAQPIEKPKSSAKAKEENGELPPVESIPNESTKTTHVAEHEVESPVDESPPVIQEDIILPINTEKDETSWTRPPLTKATDSDAKKAKVPLSQIAKSSKVVKPPQEIPEDKNTSRNSELEIEDSACDDNKGNDKHRLAELRYEQTSVDIKDIRRKAGVKVEEGPMTEMWSNIVNKSLVGTGVYVKAAICNLETGGIFSCNPQEFTPSTAQVKSLRENFHNASSFAAAGFGVADAIFEPEEEQANKELLCGVSSDGKMGIVITYSKTVMLIGVYTGKRDQALNTAKDMREYFESQGL